MYIRHVLVFVLLLASQCVWSQPANHFVGDESKCPYLHPEIRFKPIVLDDFENEVTSAKQWSHNGDNGSLHSSLELSDSAKEGKKGARISFTGTRDKNSWTDLYCIASYSGKNKITFWAKAEKPVKVMVKVNQGVEHDHKEMFGKTISLTTDWNRYEVRFDEIKELIFSHLQHDGKAPSGGVNQVEMTGIGFNEVDVPAVFYIDQLQLE